MHFKTIVHSVTEYLVTEYLVTEYLVTEYLVTADPHSTHGTRHDLDN
jgi:hypothetical protein